MVGVGTSSFPVGEMSKMSRSKNRNEIEILKVLGMGQWPPYIELAQRHFEKEKPDVPGVVDSSGYRRATVTAPTDLMRLVLPEDVVDQIESLELVYATKE